MMSLNMYRIGVIVRPKKTDALICRSLAKYFYLEVAEYGIPKTDWVPWILKRIQNAGLLTFVGHLALSAFIKCEQIIERLSGRTIWKKCGVRTPEWSQISRAQCRDEQSLRDQFKNVDLIIALDAFRLSQPFFRGLRVPYLEVTWGNATKYLGDSAAFWEYALEKETDVMVSIIKRTAYFQKIEIVSQVPVITIGSNETLRSLKVKQAIEIADKIPKILLNVLTESRDSQEEVLEQKRLICQCYAPSLWIYARYRMFGLHSLPRYACRRKEVMLKIPRDV